MIAPTTRDSASHAGAIFTAQHDHRRAYSLASRVVFVAASFVACSIIAWVGITAIAAESVVVVSVAVPGFVVSLVFVYSSIVALFHWAEKRIDVLAITADGIRYGRSSWPWQKVDSIVVQVLEHKDGLCYIRVKTRRATYLCPIDGTWTLTKARELASQVNRFCEQRGHAARCHVK